MKLQIGLNLLLDSPFGLFLKNQPSGLLFLLLSLFLFALHPRIIFDYRFRINLQAAEDTIPMYCFYIFTIGSTTYVSAGCFLLDGFKLLQSWVAVSSFQITFLKCVFFLDYSFKATLHSLCTQTASKFCCCSSAILNKMCFPAFFFCLLVLPL